MTADDTDYASAYHELRERLRALLRDRPAGDLELLAPATPAWRVRDVVAHLGGVCDDIIHGNMAGVASDEWTSTHVETRRDWSFDRVLADWDEHATAVEAMMNDLGPAIGQMLADAATHEHDIRGALGAPGARDSDALVIGFDWGMHAVGQRLDTDGTGALLIEHEGGTTTVGTGDPASKVRATRFELARAMAGRRSDAQMRGYDWDGPFVDLVLSRDIFTPPEVAVVE